MNILEKRTITITTISPIHIKGKEIDYGQGFVRRDSQTAYAIDSNKLAEYLYYKTNDLSLVNKYVNTVEGYISNNKLKKFVIGDFLSSNGIFHYQHNRKWEKELIDLGVFKSIVNAPNEDKFVRNGKGKPFIPGSSVKGALRTAVMYYLARQFLNEKQDNPVKSFLKNISDEITKFRKKTKSLSKRKADIERSKFSQAIQQYIFQNRTMGIKTYLDFFRCIKVKDSSELKGLSHKKIVLLSLQSPVEKKRMVSDQKQDLTGKIGTIIQVGHGFKANYQGKHYDFTNKVYNKKFAFLRDHVGRNIRILDAGDDKIKKIELTAEKPEAWETPPEIVLQTYPLGIKVNDKNQPVDFDIETFTGTTHINITLDACLLSHLKEKNNYIPFSTIEDVFALADKFSRELWDYEKRFFESCSDDRLDISYVRNFYANRNIPGIFRIGWGSGFLGMTINLLLEEFQQKELRNRMFIDRENFPAPKSKRLIYENGQVSMPLGWVSFKSEER